jgi:hypothetical protein
MDEEEFDSMRNWAPWGTANFRRTEVQQRRVATLSAAVFGRSNDYLQRQLLAGHPEAPEGFDLDDYRELQRHMGLLEAVMNGGRHLKVLRVLPDFWQPIVIGTQSYTAWEARREIVRRIIEFLKGH